MIKKIFCCLLAILMIGSIITMTACNNTGDETTAPTEAPTEEPTEAPTEEPTEAPTEEPTEAPTEEPTEALTEEPTEAPTEEPTEAPTEEPTEAPTEEPTEAPTEEPTEAPTELQVPEYEDIGISNKVKLTNLFDIAGLRDGVSYVLCDKILYRSRYAATFKEGVILMDAQTVAAIFGFTYSETDTTATMTSKNLTLKFTVDSASVTVGANEYNFPKVVKEDGVILVSVDFVARWLGCTVETVDSKAYIATPKTKITDAKKKSMDTLHDKYRDIVFNYDDIEIEQTGVGLYEKTPYEDRVVGIAYATWHESSIRTWGTGTWDIPLNGGYWSNDRDVIYEHGILLRDAGVDFVFVDWTNNTSYNPDTMSASRRDYAMIEDATDLLFEVWSTIEGAPKICIFAGPGHAGPLFDAKTTGEALDRHQDKVDQIYENYVTKYPDMYFCHDGKPLLMCYGATPHQYGVNPDWEDERFTVRWLTGFVAQQPGLYNSSTLETNGFWSWEERGLQTFTVNNNLVECVTVSAASREQIGANYIPAYGRQNGLTLKKQFQRANDLGAGMVIIVSWNEWTTGEQPTAEISKDTEPSEIYGTYYYDLMCEQIKKYKGQID